jgi:SAM-dependent methyltransferase
MEEPLTMTPDHNTPLFHFHDPENIHRIRDVFEAAGYTDAGILDALGAKDLSAIRGDDVPLLLQHTNQGTPLETLIRLFLIKIPCEPEAVRQALRPTPIETWIEGGLLQAEKGLVVAGVELLPFKDLLLAYDKPNILGTPFKENYVMGIGSSTITLANLTVRNRCRRTLDLGTGNGIHGLLASPHSDRVTGVDLNPRAVAFAAFNADLNGISNMDCVQGDMLEPVKGRTFDLVVTNPPFVISPETRYIYRDSGMQADGITRKIVREIPDLLNEGGFCQILCNWAVKTGGDWHDRLGKWFANTGCDAWVMRSETDDAAEYAAKWIRHTERDETAGYRERFRKWMTYYEEQGIEAVCAGVITMRRSSGHVNWYRWDDTPQRMLGPCGDAVVQGFQLYDFLETMKKDEDLLHACVCFSSDVRLERQSKPSADGWMEEVTRIHLVKGFAYSGNIDRFIANLIVGCDGKHTLEELMDKMAVSLGAKPKDIAPAFCGIVRGLIEKGYLLPEAG